MFKAILITSACGLATVFAEPATLTIEPQNQQKITQWGIATHNRPDWNKSYAIANYPASCDALYRDLGATVMRFHIDYQTYDQTKPREHLRDGILAVTERGMDWYGLPWSPPAFMKTIEHVNGRVKGEINRLKPGYEDDVAKWLVELVQWLEKEGVKLPVALGFQNEPDWPPPSYPGCIYTPEQIRVATIELRKALDAAGYKNIRVIADEGGAPADDRYPKPDPEKGTLNLSGLHPGGFFETDPVFRNALGIIGTHTYDIHSNLYNANPAYMQQFYDAVRKSGKESWMSEWEVRHEHAHSDWDVITENILHFNRDLAGLGFNGWVYWQVWQSGLFKPCTEDPGECVHKVRPTDQLIYKAVDLGINPKSMTIRASAKNGGKVTLSVHLDSADGPIIGEMLIPQTARRNREFESFTFPLSPTTGTHDLYLTFSSPEAWQEVDLNWFQPAGKERIEAESFSSKVACEKWSSSIQPNYNVDNSLMWVQDDGQTLQKRPTYYIYEKIWNNAPADGKTFVRLVNSDSPAFQGATRAASPASFRQDLAAFVHPDAMTVVVLNRGPEPQTVNLQGLTGSKVELYRYTRADASSVNTEMHRIGSATIRQGALQGLELPGDSLNIFVTNSGIR